MKSMTKNWPTNSAWSASEEDIAYFSK